MKNNRWLVVILVLQGLILAGQWTANRSALPAARAMDIPDPGARQIELINAVKDTNSKLDTIIGLLQGGELQVRVVQPDEGKGASQHR